MGLGSSGRRFAIGLSRLSTRRDGIATSRRLRSSGFTFESEVLIEAAHHGHPTLAVTIPGRYPHDARPSHYRAIVDTAKIVVMVAIRLLRKGLYPRGLWRGMGNAPVLTQPAEAALDKHR